jgi:hypothetical protein
MAAGPPDPSQRDRQRERFWERQRADWHDELCAEHNGTVRSFEGLSLKIDEIEDYEELFQRKGYNLLRLGKIGGVVATGALLLTPAAIAAAPHLAASLGAAGVLGAAGTGTTISTLSGAALGSASLAAIGGGTMAGGVMVVTAAGVALGGTLGGVVSNAYLSEVKDFKIRKQNEGKGPSIICVDGFLTQKMDDPREWKRALRTRHRRHNWYHLNWEAKTRYQLGSMLCRDSTGEAARLFGTTLARRAAKQAGSKMNPAMWVAVAADMIRNPWHVAMMKAPMTGAVLADILARTSRKEFILIGHSLGARVINSTLLALSTKTAKPIIRDVYLLGGAVGTGAPRDWESVSKAVCGKIHNCYSTNDQVLRCLYRAATGMISRPVGAYPIRSRSPKIVDWDFSDVVKGHTDWKGCLSEVLAGISGAEPRSPNSPKSPLT